MTSRTLDEFPSQTRTLTLQHVVLPHAQFKLDSNQGRNVTGSLDYFSLGVYESDSPCVGFQGGVLGLSCYSCSIDCWKLKSLTSKYSALYCRASVT